MEEKLLVEHEKIKNRHLGYEIKNKKSIGKNEKSSHKKE
jgi:hypothetical protein